MSILLYCMTASQVHADGPPVPLNPFPSWLSSDLDGTTAVAWGDMDGDGDLDLAVGNSWGTPNRVYLNENGYLPATAAWTSAVSDWTASVAWGDVDGDGDLDLAAGNDGRNKVYQNQNGTLSNAIAWTSVETDTTRSIAWGDMDSDGDLDLAVGNDLGEPNRVYLNENGTLSTTIAWTSVETDTTHSVAWGDMDGDGDLDLAVGNGEGEPNRVYLNESGTLSITIAWTSVETDTTHSIAWGDVDGDGDLDLAVGNGGDRGGPNRIYLNHNGLLETTASWTSDDADNTRSVAWGDVNGDGYLDLVAGDYGAVNKVYVNSGGRLDSTAAWTSGDIEYTYAVAWGDIDNDGDLDLAVANDYQSNTVYQNIGAMLLASAAWESTDWDTTHSVAWGDMDGDGDLDLAVGNDLGEPNRVYLNENGALSTTIAWTSVETDTTYSVAWGDMDGDGDLDLAVGNDLGEPNRVYLNENGALSTTVSWTSVETDTTRSIAWGDMDGDGDLDLAVGNSGEPNRVYLNQGDSLQTAAAWSSYDYDFTASVAWGDIDSDGDLDLAVGNGILNLAVGNIGQPNKVYLNEGGTLQTTAAWQDVDSDPTLSVAWADVDGDGDLDLTAGNWAQPNKVYLNEAGTLQTAAAWVSNDSDDTYSVAWTDANGDGALDLAAGNWMQPNKVYLNEGAMLHTTAAWTSADQDETLSIAWGDVDGDGDLDLVAGNDGPNKIYEDTRDTQASVSPIPVIAISHPGTTAPANFYASAEILADSTVPITYTVKPPYGQSIAYIKAFYSLDGGGRWLPAVATTGTMTTNLNLSRNFTISATRPIEQIYNVFTDTVTPIADDATTTATLTLTATDSIIDLNVWVDIIHTWDGDLIIDLVGPSKEKVRLVDQRGGYGDDFSGTVFDDEAITPIWLGEPPFGGHYRPEEPLSGFDGAALAGTWTLVITDAYPANTGILLSWGLEATVDTGLVYTCTAFRTDPAVYTYTWDVLRSGVFGRSDDVVFRLEAVPSTPPITNHVAGPYMYGVYASDTFPFRVRGSQVRVLSSTTPVSNAIVYRQAAGWAKSTPYADLADKPFRTDSSGYLQGRGQLKAGDRLVALLPVAGEDTKTLEEGFEDSFPPVGWALYQTGAPDAPGWQHSVDNPHGGTQCAWHDDNDTDGDAVSWLVTSRFIVPVDGRLTFWQRDYWQSWYNYHGVWITSDANPDPSIATYIELWSGDTGDQWVQQTVDLSAFVGQAVYIAFRYEGDGEDEWYIDDVAVEGRYVNPYTLYHTSAAPTLTGLDTHAVTGLGVQTLTVSSDHPLMLFNLDVSLQWDARNDDGFLSSFKFNLDRTSELLYDWTDGQAALGRVTIFHQHREWNFAHLRVYASNRVRPMAVRGGIYSHIITEVVTHTGSVTLTYGAGQMHMGAVWNRYGEAGSELNEDWPRALAHELGHYVFFLDDNYLGLDESGRLIPVETCPGAMTDPYREDYPYDEFHPEADWLPACERTLSNQSTGRSDWATIVTFYPWLSEGTVNTGPNNLPLAVTQIEEFDHAPDTPSTALEDPTFYFSEGGARVQPAMGTRAFMFQDDADLGGMWAIDLGQPKLDRVVARGARPGDRVCVYELTAERVGCETVSAGDQQLELVTHSDWQPDITVSPVNSQTIDLSVTNVSADLALQAQLFPVMTGTVGTIVLTDTGNAYIGTFHLPFPVTEGYVQIWVDELEPRREAVTDFAVGGNPASMRGIGASMRGIGASMRGIGASMRGIGASMRGIGASMRGIGAPVISMDGQVILFVDETAFAPDEFYTVQPVAVVPSPPAWAKVVGKGYRVSATDNAPDLSAASINFTYMGQEVATGEEPWLRIYFWNGIAWEQLPTTLDLYQNSATALAQGEGLYALMSSFEIPLYGPGWNNISYPLQEPRPVPEALLSISGYYTTVYGYEPTDPIDPWKMYDVTVPEWVNDLHVMEYGHGYWINVSRPITWRVSDTSIQSLAATSVPPYPPATYYGRVLSSSDFTPTVGTSVSAWVGDTFCGQGKTLSVNEQVVYVVNVFAAGSGSTAGCGVQGSEVTFRLGEQVMDPTVAWDNNRVREVALSPREPSMLPVYLPLVMNWRESPAWPVYLPLVIRR